MDDGNKDGYKDVKEDSLMMESGDKDNLTLPPLVDVAGEIW